MKSIYLAEARNLMLRGNRTYHVSDERLRAFAQLSYAQRLQWVEQCSQFVKLAQMAKAKLLTGAPKSV